MLIYIENQPHELEGDDVSAEQIRSLGGVPADNKVFRETAGDDPDPEIPPVGKFEVRHGEKFYAVPPGVFGSPLMLEDESAELSAQFGGGLLDGQDGQRYLVLDRYPLGPGWTPVVSRLAMRVTGYPEAALDGFLVPGEVRLSAGMSPANASLTSVFGGELWWLFSYHPQGWRVGRHSLRSFLGFVRGRLAENR